jgi:hypothetical protein
MAQKRKENRRGGKEGGMKYLNIETIIVYSTLSY